MTFFYFLIFEGKESFELIYTCIQDHLSSILLGGQWLKSPTLIIIVIIVSSYFISAPLGKLYKQIQGMTC